MGRTWTGRATAQELVVALLEVAGSSPPEELADRLCRTAARVLGLHGASLGVLFTTGMAVPVGVSGPAAARAEELQFTASDGPCWEALRSERAVVVGDLTDDDDERWRGYARAVLDASDVRAVVAVPTRLASGLQVTFCCYYDAPLPDGEVLDAEAISVGLQRVLDEASPPAEEGGAAWLDSSTTLRRVAVWLAEVQLMRHRHGLDHEGALEAMRAHCRRSGGTVDDLAAEVVRGTRSAEEVLRPR